MSPLPVPQSVRSPLQTALLFVVGFGITLGFVAYVVFQARFLIAGPQILFTSVPELVQSERVVTLEGTASNIVRITLNDRQIFTDSSGTFSEQIVLENGYTVATIRAEDRYGRTTAVEQAFVYHAPVETAATSSTVALTE